MGKTLVTGATGFIGSHLVRTLLERGEGVRVLVRDPDRLSRVGLYPAPGVEVFQGDLLDPASITRALAGVDRLYHAAGFISTSKRDREQVYRLNYDITENLFTAAAGAGLDKIVYLASIFALGAGQGQEPVAEDVEYNLDSLGIDYFAAKRRAELYARDCAARGLPIVFVYPCFCYGPGDIYLSSSRLLLFHLRHRLPVSFAGGHNAMDVRDAAATLVRAMDRGQVGERYIAGGANHSYEELGRMLAGLTGYGEPRISLPRRLMVLASHVAERLPMQTVLDVQSVRMTYRYWYYDDTKARRDLGHESRPLEQTFADAIRWLCEQGHAPWPKAMR